MFAVKQVIIVTQNVKFAMDAKRAFEQDGSFAAHHYTKPASAIDALIHIKPDVAILDFRVTNMPAGKMIAQLRLAKPGAAIIAAPDHPAVRDLMAKQDVQAVIDIPISMRKLLPLLRNIIKERESNQPDTAAAPSIDDTSTRLMTNYVNTLEFWVTDGDTGGTQIMAAVDPDKRDVNASRIFEKLAAEEPPMPSAKEGSTVRDLQAAMADPEVVNRVIVALREDASAQQASEEIDAEELQVSPVSLILDTTLDPTTPLENFSYDTFREVVKERSIPGQRAILPLPSWVKEDRRFVSEPDFLDAELPPIPPPIEYTASTTISSHSDLIEAEPGEMTTDQLETMRKSRPADEADIVEQNMIFDDMADSAVVAVDKEEFAATDPTETEEQAVVAPPSVVPDGRQVIGANVQPRDAIAIPADSAMPFTEHNDDDQRVVQLALTLTQVALELAVEATLLALDGEFVAYAGNLPPEEVKELRDQVGDDWQTDEEKDRIRFVTLPSTNVDYMLYSRHSVDGYTLSMVFPGSMPVQIIRRQGAKLAGALANAPMPDILPDPLPEAEVGKRAPLTFVWLLRDPEAILSEPLRELLVFELQSTLLQQGWFINGLEVGESYLYIFADVPTKIASHTIIHDLMQLSAEVVQAADEQVTPEALWHPSFRVVKPGKLLDEAAIQRFIDFVRR